MSKRTREITMAVLAIGAAVVVLYLTFAGQSERLNLDTYEVLGAVTAEETAKLLGNKGRVLVMVRDTGPDKNPSVESELKAFQKTLNKRSGVSVIVEKVQVTPMLMMSTGGGLPPDELLKALETHAKVDAAVLFFGFPQLSDAQWSALKKTSVKIVVVSSFRPGYARLLKQHAINLAIVPRAESPAPGAQSPRTVRERFDHEYLILTGEIPRSP
jgi:hypothetical protein